MTQTPYLPEGCKLVEHEIAIVVECPFTHSKAVLLDYFERGWQYIGSGGKPTEIGTRSTEIAHLRFSKPVDGSEPPSSLSPRMLIRFNQGMAKKYLDEVDQLIAALNEPTAEVPNEL